jgi:hypothetical protein
MFQNVLEKKVSESSSCFQKTSEPFKNVQIRADRVSILRKYSRKIQEKYRWIQDILECFQYFGRLHKVKECSKKLYLDLDL